MVRSLGSSRLTTAVLLSVVAATSAQSNGPTPYVTPPSTAISTPTSTSNTASTPTSTDIALSLWSDANSLLTSYYPSTSLTAVNTLTWPSTVVLGSSTYAVHGSTGTAATSVLAEQTGQPSNTSPKPLRSDQKLGIVIGVVIGAVVLAFLTFIFCFLSRRKKANGTYFLRRPTPSIADTDEGAWRAPQRFEPMSDRGPQNWVDSYSRLPVQAQPPMSMHPAYVRQHSSRSTSEDNPFFTPQERMDDAEPHHELEGAGLTYPRNNPYEINGHHNPYDSDTAYAPHGTQDLPGNHDFHDVEAAGVMPFDHTNQHEAETRHSLDPNRPPTPFSPMMMMMGGGNGHGLQQPQRDHNPFSSPEDDEADDVISPIIPARSPERRHSPMVHYPSWSEVSEFDFNGTGRGGRRSANDQSSSDESGADGYRPHPNRRESVIGRTELP